jgi:hypothetical protein
VGHLERRAPPESLAGVYQTGDDADIASPLVLQKCAKLFDPAADEGNAMQTEHDPSGGQSREPAAARQGDGHHQQRIEVN